MYKQDYIEMREGVGQPILPATIKERRVGSGRKISLLKGYNEPTIFSKSTKEVVPVQGSVALTNNVIHYGQQSGYLYYTLTPHPLIERAPPMHNPATAEQREFSDPDIALSMFICVIECGLNEREFEPGFFVVC